MAAPERRRWVVLLRGVNVGGGGRLPMADLRAALGAAGFHDVRTYIQSGNVVLDADRSNDADQVAARVATTIEDGFGFRPWIHLLDAGELRGIIAANPYGSAAEADPTSVHYHFVREVPPATSLARLTELADGGEDLSPGEDVVYLLAPNGIGRSKLAEALTKELSPRATARNHRSVLAVAALADGG